jgi:DNA-binding beta-propeller fold protein YncE
MRIAIIRPMENRLKTRVLFCLLPFLVTSASLAQNSAGGFSLAKSIPMPGVQGKFDHSAVDVKGKRLFVAATGNKSVEVLDLNSGQWINRIAGIGKAQGIYYVPDFNLLIATDGIGAAAKFYKGDTLAPLQTVSLSADADYVTYDPVGKRFFVAHGGDDAGHDYGEIAIIDAATLKIVSSIRTAGHPEAMKLDNQSHLFVNVPDANHIAVADPATAKVTSTWPLTNAKKNVPMALNEKDGRLYIATRDPGLFFAYDSSSGKIVASIPTVGGADDMAYDPRRRQIYVSGGDGYVAVIHVDDADHYREIGRLATGPNAKTSLFAPEFNSIYVAVPAQTNQPAVLKIFQASN